MEIRAGPAACPLRGMLGVAPFRCNRAYRRAELRICIGTAVKTLQRKKRFRRHERKTGGAGAPAAARRNRVFVAYWPSFDIPPIGGTAGAGAAAGAGATLRRRATFFFVFLVLFAFTVFFFRAGAARFAAFFAFFAFAFFRFFAMVLVLPERFNPHTVTIREAAGVSVSPEPCFPSRP